MPEKLSLKPLPDHVIVRQQKNKRDEWAHVVFAAGKEQELLQPGDEVTFAKGSNPKFAMIDGEVIIVGPAVEFVKVEQE